jgi:hypothetical protein
LLQTSLTVTAAKALALLKWLMMKQVALLSATYTKPSIWVVKSSLTNLNQEKAEAVVLAAAVDSKSVASAAAAVETVAAVVVTVVVETVAAAAVDTTVTVAEAAAAVDLTVINRNAQIIKSGYYAGLFLCPPFTLLPLLHIFM